MSEEEKREWDAFTASLVWKPIGEYDKAAGAHVMLRAGYDWALGYWGELTMFSSADANPDDAYPAGPAWRHAQVSLMEMALPFEPTEFATVGGWEPRLFYD